MSNLQPSGSNSRNGTSVSLDTIDSVLEGFREEMIDMKDMAIEATSTPQAIADSVECGEVWQAIVSRQDQRKQHIIYLTWYTQGVLMEDDTKAIQSFISLLAHERDQVNEIVRKILQARYTPINEDVSWTY